jgi:hypothetical protein
VKLGLSALATPARYFQSLGAVRSAGETFWLDTSIFRNDLKLVIASNAARRAQASHTA